MKISRDDKHNVIITIAIALALGLILAIAKGYVGRACMKCRGKFTVIFPRLERLKLGGQTVFTEHNHLLCLSCGLFNRGEFRERPGQEEPEFILAEVIEEEAA